MSNRSREGMFPPWLLWIIGPVTVLAAALIIFAVVLGIQAGQRQVEMQRRQQVGIALQRAIDLRAEGRLQEALAEYQKVLQLDPSNSTALEGMENLLQIALGNVQPPTAGVPPQSAPGAEPDATNGQAPVSTPSAQTPVPIAQPGTQPSAAAASTPASEPTTSAQEQSWTRALEAYQAGRWQEAVDLLLRLSTSAPTFRTAQVKDMLYNAYVNLAAQEDQSGNLEEALGYVDKALALQPDSTALKSARAITAKYLDVLAALEQKNLERAVELLEELYVQDPNYRDVEARLVEALQAYGEELVRQQDWCGAAEQYTALIAIDVPPGSIARRDSLQAQCDNINERVAANATATAAPFAPPTATPSPTATSSVQLEPVADATETGELTPEVEAVATDTPEPTAAPAAPSAPAGGRILYTMIDPNTNASLIMLHPIGGEPVILAQNGQQAVFRPDGQRFVYRNLRDDNRGLTALDPATGLELRFTEFAEDSMPSWNSEGNRIVFASNREGDRLWRIYNLWADVNSESVVLGFGTNPAWQPGTDRVAFHGCDESGNRCGLLTISSGGGDYRSLTTVPADNNPAWSPDGSFAAFMSDGRDGNPEIYQVNVASGAVTRLTEHAGIDAAPAVSPDGQWIAFLSNREGRWAIWAVPANGGEAQLLIEMTGSPGNWVEQKLQWIN